MRRNPVAPETRKLVAARAGHYCEVCGLQPPDQIHHRRPRGMGSTRRPESHYPTALLALCAACHQMVESRRALAYELGWLVRQGHNPAEIPVLRHGCDWVLLDDHGNTTPCNETNTDRGKP